MQRMELGVIINAFISVSLIHGCRSRPDSALCLKQQAQQVMDTVQIILKHPYCQSGLQKKSTKDFHSPPAIPLASEVAH
jgi:hypothetical protein